VLVATGAAGVALALLGLAVLPAGGPPVARVVALAALALLPGGVALVLQRRTGARDDRLALGAAGALSVAGFGVGIWLGWAPGGLAFALAALAWTLAAGVLEGRVEAPVTLPEVLQRVALHAVAPLAVALAAAIGTAGLGAAAPAPTPERARAVYDLDARLATRPRPDCAQQAAASRVLVEQGAHPRLSLADGSLWFDAPVDGRRQIHRRDAATGAVTCWTCGEPGHNQRPALARDGAAVVFDTDRWKGDGESGTELHRASTQRPGASLRLTRRPGADERPALGPSARVIAWAHRSGGRSAVVSASLVSGHGGVLLGAPGTLAAGGSRWVAPLAWSPDARTLVVARGNPLGDLEARRIDPATGEAEPLAFEVGHGPAGISADGGWLALTRGERMPALGVLPASFGTVLAPRLAAVDGHRPLLRRTLLVTGPPSGPLREVPLGKLEAWGEPTGVALDGGGTRAVVGQRRFADGVVRERLVEISLVCAPGG